MDQGRGAFRATGSGPEAGPEADFARMVLEHAQRVQRVLRGRGVAERDLPDAQQEVFLVAHRKLAAFEGRSSLGTWLHRIALNVASEHRRRARNRYERLADPAHEAPSACDPSAALEARDALERVSAALQALSEQQREAFLLYEIEGLSMRAVAERLDIPLKTAFSRLYAARRALGCALGRRGIALPDLGAAIGLWLGMRFVSQARAHAAVCAPAASLQLAAIALACGVLPAAQSLPIASPALVAAAERPPPRPERWVSSASSLRAREAAHRAPRPLASPGTDAGEGTAAHAVTRLRAARHTRAPQRRAPRASETPASAPAAAGEVAFDDLIVTRASAADVRPRLPHPLSARVAGPPSPPRIQLRGAHGAADPLEHL